MRRASCSGLRPSVDRAVCIKVGQYCYQAKLVRVNLNEGDSQTGADALAWDLPHPLLSAIGYMWQIPLKNDDIIHRIGLIGNDMCHLKISMIFWIVSFRW
jgi:hypothetical protein